MLHSSIVFEDSNAVSNGERCILHRFAVYVYRILEYSCKT